MDEDSIYIVSSPTFRACHASGKTIDEALSNLAEVITLCLEAECLPESNQFVAFREVEINIPENEMTEYDRYFGCHRSFE